MNRFTSAFTSTSFVPQQINTTMQVNIAIDLPTKLQTIFAPHIRISDVITNVAADELNVGLLALDGSQPKVNELDFMYEGRMLTLANAVHDGDSYCLELKNNFGFVLTRFENFSVEKLRSRLTLLKLFSQLSPEARETFHPLFDLATVGRINPNSPIVSGDLDGSTARQIILGIQAGIVSVDDLGITLLAEIMEAETDVLCDINASRTGELDEETAAKIVQIILEIGVEMSGEVERIFAEQKTALARLSVVQNDIAPILFAWFQGNENIQNKMHELASLHLTFQKGHTPFISIGDGAHDRFSNNKDADRFIRGWMKNHGAIFILGNHDVHMTKIFDQGTYHVWAYGCFARDTATSEHWEEHQNFIFQHAYYDESTKTLYLHHGLGPLQLNTNGGYHLPTAFGNYSLPQTGQFEPTQFVQALNGQSRPKPLALCKDETSRTENMRLFEFLIGFRPTNDSMKVTAEALGIRIVHGHNEEVMISEDGSVIGLNPRRNKLYTVCAVRLGEPGP